MLIIRCAACKTKIWRYDKIGPGEVLRCHKSRIDKVYSELSVETGKLTCKCGKSIGIDKGSFYLFLLNKFQIDLADSDYHAICL